MDAGAWVALDSAVTVEPSERRAEHVMHRSRHTFGRTRTAPHQSRDAAIADLVHDVIDVGAGDRGDGPRTPAVGQAAADQLQVLVDAEHPRGPHPGPLALAH